MKTLLEPKTKEIEIYTEEDYNNMLDECYPECNIAGMTFSTSHALKEIDPITYQCGFNDYQEYKTVYLCPICNTEFEDEEEAKFCCQTEEEENN